MIKIVHIINALPCEGAQNMLMKLCRYSEKDRYSHEIISLRDEGAMGKSFHDMGIKIHSLHIRKRNIIKSLIRARDICRRSDIISTWLYHADTFGFIVSKLLLRKPLIWNIRHGNLDKRLNKKATLRFVRLNSFLSRFADCITFNSEYAYNSHIKTGYRAMNPKIIPNGFEPDIFKHRPEDRIRIRKELGIKDEKLLISIGRWNTQKDYPTLFKALSELKKYNIDFRLVMAGNKLDQSNGKLLNLIWNFRLGEDIILLGIRRDIPELLSSADVYISSSIGESFPNSLGEAMSCGLPCIVTDAGDSAKILNDEGIIVMPGDYEAMAEGIVKLLSDHDNYSRRSRTRIEKNYHISRTVLEFEKIFSHP